MASLARCRRITRLPRGVALGTEHYTAPEQAQGKSAGGHQASRLALETVADVRLPFLATPLPSSSSLSASPASSWRMLRDERIKGILAQGGDPQKMARTLVDEANLAGGEGNVSAIVVGIQ